VAIKIVQLSVSRNELYDTGNEKRKLRQYWHNELHACSLPAKVDEEGMEKKLLKRGRIAGESMKALDPSEGNISK
jgi:hypothetical protein